MNKFKKIAPLVVAGLGMLIAIVNYFTIKESKESKPKGFTTDWGGKCPYPKGSPEAANWIKHNKPKDNGTDKVNSDKGASKAEG